MIVCAGSDYPASLDSTYLYRVSDPPCPPVIREQPQNVSVAVGTAVTLAVGAQELQTPEPTAGKMSEVPAATVTTEETKTVVIKAEEVRPETTSIQETKSEGIAGLASYYAAKFHGKRTASGERFSQKLLTAAGSTVFTY